MKNKNKKMIPIFVLCFLLGGLGYRPLHATFPHPSDLVEDSKAAIHLALDNSYSMDGGVVHQAGFSDSFSFLGVSGADANRIGRYASVVQTLAGPLKCKVLKTSVTSSMAGAGVYKTNEGRIDLTHGKVNSATLLTRVYNDEDYRSLWVKVISDDRNGLPTSYTEFEIVPVPVNYINHISASATSVHLFKGDSNAGQGYHSFGFGDPWIAANHGVTPRWSYGFTNSSNDTNAHIYDYTYQIPASSPPVFQNGSATLFDETTLAGQEDYFFFMPEDDVSFTCEPRDPNVGLLNEFWADTLLWSLWTMDSIPRASSADGNGGYEKVELGKTRESSADSSHVNFDIGNRNAPVIESTNVEGIIASLLAPVHRNGKRESPFIYGTPSQDLLREIKDSITPNACTNHFVLFLTDGAANLDRFESNSPPWVPVNPRFCSPFYRNPAGPQDCQRQPDRQARLIQDITGGPSSPEVYVVNTTQGNSGDNWTPPGDPTAMDSVYLDANSAWIPGGNGVNDMSELNKRVADLGGGKFFEVVQPQDLLQGLQEIFSDILSNLVLSVGPVVTGTALGQGGTFIASTDNNPLSVPSAHGDIKYFNLDANLQVIANANPPSAVKSMETEETGTPPAVKPGWFTDANLADSNARENFDPSNANLTPLLLNLSNPSNNLDNVFPDAPAPPAINNRDVAALIRYVRADQFPSAPSVNYTTGPIPNVVGKVRSEPLDAFQIAITNPDDFQLNKFNQRGYTDFVFNKVISAGSVLLGQTDDGILHCFDASKPAAQPTPVPGDTLSRLGSFVPKNLLPHLKNLRQTVHEHMAFAPPFVTDFRDDAGIWGRFVGFNTPGNATHPGSFNLVRIVNGNNPRGTAACAGVMHNYASLSHPDIAYPMTQSVVISISESANNPGDKVRLFAVFDRFSDRVGIFDRNSILTPSGSDLILRPVADSLRNNGLIDANGLDGGYAWAGGFDLDGDGGTDLILMTNYFGVTFGIHIDIADASSILAGNFKPFIFFDPLAAPGPVPPASALDFGSRLCDVGTSTCTASQDRRPTDNHGAVLFRARAFGDNRALLPLGSDIRSDLTDSTRSTIHQVQLSSLDDLTTAPFGRGIELNPPNPNAPPASLWPLDATSLADATGNPGSLKKTVFDVVVLRGIAFILTKHFADPNSCEVGEVWLYARNVYDGTPLSIFLDNSTGTFSSEVQLTNTTNDTINFDAATGRIVYSYKSGGGTAEIGVVQAGGGMQPGTNDNFVK